MIEPIRARIAGLGLMAAALLSVAPTVNAETKVLRMAIAVDLKVIDPMFSNAYVTRDFGYMNYDTLFSRDSKGEPQPQMLSAFTHTPDYKNWTFTLRPGLKFHDGQPVTANDVVATLNRWAKRATMGLLLARSGAQWQRVDDKTFSLSLSEPIAQVPLVLATKALFVVPAKQAEAYPDTPIPDPMGSGPFIFKKSEWIPGNRVVFDRDPNYVSREEPPDGLAGAKKVKVDRVEWRYMGDPNTAISALKNGEVDLVNSIPADYQPMLATDSSVKLGQTGTWQIFAVANTLHPPFKAPAARRALLHMVNQDEVLAGIGFPATDGKSHACFAVFMCGGANETTVGSEHFQKQDFDQAKKDLAEAGYKGEKIVFLQSTDGSTVNAALIWLQYLQKAGMDVDAQQLDQSSLLARVYKKDPPAQGGWNLYLTASKIADVDTPLSNGWIASSCKNSVVPGWPCDAKIDEYRDAWLRETDPAKRHELVDKLQRRFYEAPAYIPFAQYPAIFGARKNILHTEQFATGIPILWNVDK